MLEFTFRSGRANLRLALRRPEVGTSTINMLRAKPTLEKLVAEQLRRAPANEQPLLAWAVVCGRAVAEKTAAQSFSDGELHVTVPDRGWQTQLISFVPQYIAGINRIVGKGVVRRITFITADAKKSHQKN
jgi:predicted nucleic acid-binding Zn ribbon protein